MKSSMESARPVLAWPAASLCFASGVVRTEGLAALPSLLGSGTATVHGAQCTSHSPGHPSLLKG